MLLLLITQTRFTKSLQNYYKIITKLTKHYKILVLAKNKLNSIKGLVSQALTDMEISHEEFDTILKEKKKYQKIKENVRNETEKQENVRLNSINSKT